MLAYEVWDVRYLLGALSLNHVCSVECITITIKVKDRKVHKQLLVLVKQLIPVGEVHVVVHVCVQVTPWVQVWQRSCPCSSITHRVPYPLAWAVCIALQ